MIDFKKLKYQESLKDHCGVFGIFAKKTDVAKITYVALHSLQHRGQESAGIAVSDGHTMRSIRRLGLVSQIFSDQSLNTLKGYIAIGHNRYSTTGGNTINNAQPVIIPGNGHSLALSHNGNLINAISLAAKLGNTKRYSTSDTEIAALTIVQNPEKSWEGKIMSSVSKFEGAFSIVAATKTKLFAMRDSMGFRPLVLGKLNANIIVASETCALDIVGAKYIRDVKPGEVISISAKEFQTVGILKAKPMRFCLFEYVYLARPDSVFNGQLVHEARGKSGELLAVEAPAKGDLVVAVPDSGTSAAIGFSRKSGIPFGEILIKNRYIGRTFISPDQRLREVSVKMKFNPMEKIVKGKRVIIVDDSIVRGTTMKKIVEVLRKCGAREIHLRICSPPVRWPCFFGVDTPSRRELIGSSKTIAQIRKFIGADSLHYLSLENLIKASGQSPNTLCTACFSGKYPMKVDMSFTKSVFEKNC